MKTNKLFFKINKRVMIYSVIMTFALNQTSFAVVNCAKSQGRTLSPDGQTCTLGDTKASKPAQGKGDGSSPALSIPSNAAAAAPGAAETPPPTDKPTVAQMVDATGAPQAPYSFPQFNKSFSAFQAGNAEYYAKCNKGLLSSMFGGMTGATSDGSSVGSADGNVKNGTTGTGIVSTFEGGCNAMEAKVEGLEAQARKDLETEKAKCLQDAQAKAKINSITMGSNVAKSTGINTKSCESAQMENDGILNSIWAWVKEHKLITAALIAATAGGLYSLLSSGDKQKQDFQTTPDGGGEKDMAIDSNANTSNIPQLSAAPQSANTAQNINSTATYCKTSNQPLECFVTPACDLKCVAEKYGVTNYGGMDKDTTRINKEGKAVDGASIATGNPGSDSSSSTSGSGSNGNSSGKDVIALNASGETGSTNVSGVATRGQTGEDDSDGYSGGGGAGGFGDSSDRDPANDRYKDQQGLFTRKSLASAPDPAATGPLLPISADLFQRISNVTKTQCVRELVLCNQK